MIPLRDGVLVEKEKRPEIRNYFGIIISHEMFDEFDKLKEDSLFGKVISKGEDCKYLCEGDKVVFCKGGETTQFRQDDKFLYFFKEEKFILARTNEDGTYNIHPDHLLIQITQHEREKLYKKKIKRNDGTEVDLFLTVVRGKDEESRHTVYVQTGIVKVVGYNNKYVKVGDTAILNYTVDNNDQIIVGYENEDKIVVIEGMTTTYKNDHIVYANRRTPQDTVVARKGEYDTISPLLGIIRGDEIISMSPYIFLEHKSSTVSKLSESGIIYEDNEFILERKILSVSNESSKKYGMKIGDTVLVRDCDIFSIKLGDKTISAMNDMDVMAEVKKLKAV